MTGYPPHYPDPAEDPRGAYPQDPDLILDPTEDPALREVAQVVRGVLHEHRMRPLAREQLRARLMAAAAEQVRSQHAPAAAGADRAEPEPWLPPRAGQRAVPADRPANRGGRRPAGVKPALRRRRSGRAPALGWSAVGAAAALAAVLVVLRGFPGTNVPQVGVQPVAVDAQIGVEGSVSADPAKGIVMRFSSALDRESIKDALHVSPATTVKTSWSGDTLTVSAAHGFTPNSSYVLTIDHSVARTASGAALANDVQVVFGTAPTVQGDQATITPADLSRSQVATAGDGSEAVVTNSGSILLTSASTTINGKDATGLIRMGTGAPERLASATPAICVSRSGKSIAFLSRQNGKAQLYFADAQGTPQSDVQIDADTSTPLGWIGDRQVTFVSGGRLSAVDRDGNVQVLSNSSIDVAHDTLVLAPGGRYAYLSHESGKGNVIDLDSPRGHELTGVVDVPAFSANGSTIFWVHSARGKLYLNSAPSGGGPTLTVPLPDMHKGDTVSDLAVSPDGSMLAYSVIHSGGGSELRLAELPSLATVAVSTTGMGGSPNWSPAGNMFTVLAHTGATTHIQAVDVPASAKNTTMALTAAAKSFANAQINGDLRAQQSMVSTDLTVQALAQQPTRASLLWIHSTGPRTATAEIRLSVDPSKTDPVSQQLEETLTLEVPKGGGKPRVTGVTTGSFAPAPSGPSLTHIDTTSVPGAVVLSFDSDLDPLSVPGAVALVTPGGPDIAATVHYDSATRTVTVRPATSVSVGSSGVDVVVSTSLQDVDKQALSNPIEVPVQLTKGSAG